MPQLLSSKLLPPYAGTKLVERLRLLDLFPAKKTCSATILAAPAGYGKTALITQIAQKIKEPFVWYQLDEYDNDPAVFLQYLVAGISQYFPLFGHTILNMVSQENLTAHLRLLLLNVAKELETHIQDGLVIALDDYHLINNPAIHNFIQELLHYLPSGIHLIISSRTTPPLSLSRLILQERVRLIGPGELSFTRHEINIFWCQDYDILSDTDLDALERQTTGWPAALRLISNSNSPLNKALLKTDLQGIYDYFAAEVFDQQPEKVRSFLLPTSILEDLEPSFCNQLLKRTDAGEILDYLESCHLFLIPLAGEKKTFRYHHLFRDFLRNKLGSDREPLLHQAALLYLENGEPEIAIEFFLTAKIYDNLPVIIKQAGNKAFACGNWQTVARWLDRLTDGILSSNPWLALYKAKVEVYRGRLDEAEPWSNKVVIFFASEKDPAGLTESQLLQARIYRCRGQYKKSLGILKKVQPDPASAIPHFILPLEKSLCMLMSGQLNEAKATLIAAIAAAKQHNDKYSLAYLGEALGHVYYSKGDYSLALQNYQKAAVTSPDQTLPNYYMQDAVSIIYHDWGEWELAMEYAKRNVAIKENFGLIESLPSAYIQLAGLYSDHEQWELAERYFQKAITMLQTNNGERYSLALNLMFLGECLVLQGRWTEAKIKAQEALREAMPLAGLALAICRTVGAMIFMLSGDRREANLMLSSAIIENECMNFKKGLCYAYAFKSWYHLCEDEREKAGEFAEKALTLVAELNYQQLFLGRYTMLQPILKLGLENGIEIPLVQRLLVRLGKRALPTLTELSKHKRAEVRLRTITPLTELCGQEAIQNLRHLCSDSDPEVRRSAMLATGKLFPKENQINSISVNPPSLHFLSLGPFKVYWENEKNAITWRTNKTRDLLAYFVRHQQPLGKERIIKDLWPDTTFENGTDLFHTTLYYLRHSFKKIGRNNLIRYKDKRYQLLPETFTSEDRQFQELLSAALRDDVMTDETAALLEKAVTLYRGDYLEDIDYHWVIPIRENLKHAHIDARMRLAKYYFQVHNYQKTFAHIDIIEKLEPFMEEAHSLLITIYAAKGNFSAAKNHFQKVAAIFKNELGLPLPPDIQELFRKLSAQRH